MIRKARLEDLPIIMQIVKEVIPLMHASGNTQWGEDYPTEEVFREDILAETLYLSETHYLSEGNDEGKHIIEGFLCINQDESEEYIPLKWQAEGKAIVLHRMAVSPRSRGRGVASELIAFAEEVATQESISWIKTDTNEANTIMKAMLEKRGYQYVGQVYYRIPGTPYNCYEKKL